MKRHLILVLFLLSFYKPLAQETVPQDALRLAVENLTGSARFRAMSGAFGALGGDLSALNVNPAGSNYFNYNFVSITGTLLSTKNNSNYFGTNTSDSNTRFTLNQFGTAFVFYNADRRSDWGKFTYAINYENTNCFNNSIYSAGTNPRNSIGDYFLNFAQGIPLRVITDNKYYDLNFNEQQAFLGYNTYILDSKTGDPRDTEYFSNVPSGGNYFQQNRIYNSGYNGKLVSNFSTSYRDIISFGFNLNLNFVNIRKSFTVTESNSNPINDNGSTIDYIRFDNELYTSGDGISLNVGTIIKPIKNFRVGIAYESPTWYRLTDEITQGVRTHSINNPDGNSNPRSYQYPILYLPYGVNTPGKWTGSLAYIFGNKGLLSFDVSSKNYSNTIFKPRHEDIYSDLNAYMKTNLKNALTYRVGTEYKIKQVSLRAGYRFEESPYKNKSNFGDLIGFSGGIGFSFGPDRLDFAYSHDSRKMSQEFLSSGMTDTARISSYRNDFSLTYCVNF